MLYLEEIQLGNVYYSSWVEHVYSKPLLDYNHMTCKSELVDMFSKDKDGLVRIEGIAKYMVLGVGRSGKPYIFEVTGGMVKLEKVEYQGGM
jgi:hypothetical protein